MSDYRKSYIGSLEHDALEFTPKFFVNFFTRYLGWTIHQPLSVESREGREYASAELCRDYGPRSLQVTIFGFDCGLFRNAIGPFQKVSLGVIFDDPNGWRDKASEELVRRTMNELDGAAAKLSGEQRFWKLAVPEEQLSPPRPRPEEQPSSGQLPSGLLRTKTTGAMIASKPRLCEGKRVEWRDATDGSSICQGVITNRYGTRWKIRQYDSAGTPIGEVILYDDELYDPGKLSGAPG